MLSCVIYWPWTVVPSGDLNVTRDGSTKLAFVKTPFVMLVMACVAASGSRIMIAVDEFQVVAK